MTTHSQLAAALEGRYRLERELGAGGMATVYLAEDLRHRRHVAVKVLRPELAASLGADRFLREIEVTAGLQHPHVLALYDSGQADGLLYYVMPYVPGDSLRTRLEKERQLPVGDAVRIARGVASALAYAHRLGVVHRDIKPENVLLAEGEAMVADFGIARAISEAAGSALTSTGITVGTPTYMSPEQAAAERQLDGRSDVYSLGCVLYEMLVGDAPYGGATAQVITARKLSDPVPSLRAIRESVPAALEAIVGRALAKAPADRFQTADELAAALDGVDSATRTSTYALPVEANARARWRQRAWQGVAVAGMTVSAVLAWQVVRSRAPIGSVDAVHRTAILLPDSVPLAFVGEAPLRVGRRSLDLSSDGSTLVYVGLYRGRTHLFIRRMDDERVRRLEGTEGAYGPFFHPNGNWVGYFTGSELMKVAVEGGAPIHVANAPETYGGVWLADGRMLFGKREGIPTVVGENGEASAPFGSAERLHAPGRLPGTDWVASPMHWSGLTLVSPSDSMQVLSSNGFSADLAASELIPSASPQFLRGDYLVFSRGGRLHALPFSAGSLRATGPPIALDDHVRQEVFGLNAQFTIGGDGTLVYAPGANVAESRLVVADRQGGLETLPFPPAEYWVPVWSPDGRRLAVTARVPGGMELRVLDVATGRGERPLVASRQVLTGPAWTPDGRHILYGDAAGTMEVAATGGAPSLVHPGRKIHALSPDGTQRVASDTSGHFVFGPGERVDSSAQNDIASFSRDGRWLMWPSIGPRGYEVFVSALPLGGPTFSVTPEGCVDPRWMPDGREIVCAGSDGYLYSVPLEFGSGEVRGGAPRRLTSVPLLDTPGPSWALSPDGQRMLFVASPASDTTTRLIVVTNFRRTVERKMEEAQGQAAKR